MGRTVRHGFVIPWYYVPLKSRASLLSAKQTHIPAAERDWSFIDLVRKAHEIEFRPERKMVFLHQLQAYEAERNFYTQSLRQIKQLIQVGPPNLDLKDARCEIYKISVSFEPKCESLQVFI